MARQLRNNAAGGVKANVKIDWTINETARAKMRVFARHTLKRGHPPDLQQAATQTVFERAETLCADWAP